MAVSVISPSPPPWMGSRGIQASRAPSASLSLTTGSGTTRGFSMNSASNSMARPPLLHCSFLSTSSSSSSLSSLSLSSSFSGLSLGLDMESNEGLRRGKGCGLVVRAGKAALCQTKRNRSRKSLARTHGFRRRMRTTSGRAVLKRRRAKGRRVLCTKSYPNSGKGA